jgi:hypothetical protein
MNSLSPGLKNGGKAIAGGGAGAGVIALLIYLIMQNQSGIEANKFKVEAATASQVTYATDVREVKEELTRVRELQVLMCEKLEIRGCRRR